MFPIRSHTETGGGMAKVLSALNCSGRRKKVKNRILMQDLTMMTEGDHHRLWSLWEEESLAVDDSIITDSAPLLISRHSDQDWL